VSISDALQLEAARSVSFGVNHEVHNAPANQISAIIGQWMAELLMISLSIFNRPATSQ